MVSISSYHLTKDEKKLIREYCGFVLNRFVKKSVLDKANIKVEIVHENDLEYALNVKHITRSKNPLIKFKKIMINLGHELIHIKQYLNGEMFDYVAGGVRYKGSYFDMAFQMNVESYFEAPWEIEAYGRELGLYKLFVKMKGDEKIK